MEQGSRGSAGAALSGGRGTRLWIKRAVYKSECIVWTQSAPNRADNRWSGQRRQPSGIYWFSGTASGILLGEGWDAHFSFGNSGGGVWHQKSEIKASPGIRTSVQQPVEYCCQLWHGYEFLRSADRVDAWRIWGRPSDGDGSRACRRRDLCLYVRLSGAGISDL